MTSYLRRLYERRGYIVFLAVGLLLAFSSMLLSLISLYSEEKPFVVEKQVSKEGVLAPLWVFYSIPYGTTINNTYIELNTTCPINVSVVFIERTGDLHNITVKPGEIKNYTVNDLSTIIWVEPMNCTVDCALYTRLHGVIVERRYMYLVIPSLVLFIISAIFLILAVVEKVLGT